MHSPPKAETQYLRTGGSVQVNSLDPAPSSRTSQELEMSAPRRARPAVASESALKSAGSFCRKFEPCHRRSSLMGILKA
ncbi:hypothetical protein PoB_005843300 [Plakobranchus ocellatus]|uniref:Uncharacterized protein n=1 Tax=Plakobranchus ocellatus TaxID=259542 RepID=A0AAV4CIX6_9GAST|nr:hypothetical protein PoB_005843300 [Plakobranchus ocellatus]